MPPQLLLIPMHRARALLGETRFRPLEPALTALITPGGGLVYPREYIEALAARAKLAALTPEAVRLYNASRAGRALVRQAQQDFVSQVHAKADAHSNGLLTANDIAAVLGLTSGLTVKRWSEGGKLPTDKSTGQPWLYTTNTLLAHCSWRNTTP